MKFFYDDINNALLVGMTIVFTNLSLFLKFVRLFMKVRCECQTSNVVSVFFKATKSSSMRIPKKLTLKHVNILFKLNKHMARQKISKRGNYKFPYTNKTHSTRFI